jgi:D-hexose-6-phosphate mutarotase
LKETAELPGGGVTVRLRLPEISAGSFWSAFSAEFIVDVSDKLAMELTVANQSDRPFEFENCLHTYFAVGDIGEVSIAGLRGAHYLDKTENGARKQETSEAIRISKETNRTYLDTTSTVVIRDPKLRRVIHVEKNGSNTTVVWNPWTTQRMADFDPVEHQFMVCVESGNVGQNKVTLAPGQAARLKVVLSTEAAQ